MIADSPNLESWERGPVADVATAIADLKRRHAACPPVRLLSAASADGLPADDQAAVMAHVSSCPGCLALQADLDSLDPADVDPAAVDRILADVRRDARNEQVSGRQSWTRWVPVPLAAGIVILAIGVVEHNRQRPVAPLPAVAPVAAPAVAVVPPPPAVPGPALQKPSVKLTMLALTWRSADNAGKDFASEIAPALEAFRADQYAQAEQMLGALAPHHPNAVEVPFYQGVSQLFLGRNRDALATLRRASSLADDSFAADVSWYLGIALVRSNHAAEAHTRFAALCRGKSAYASLACEANEQ